MTLGWMLAVPVIVFVALVAPIWITLHYVTEWKRLQGTQAGPDDVVVSRVELERLRQSASRLAERLDALERVIDAEFADWRKP